MSRDHKYIRKYKSKSGKWVYIYGDKDAHKEAKDLMHDYNRLTRSANRAADRSSRITTRAIKLDYKLGLGRTLQTSSYVRSAKFKAQAAQGAADHAYRTLKAHELGSVTVANAASVGKKYLSGGR